jgi:DNA polymerase-3 subunit alpha
MSAKFIHLHVKSAFSLLEGAIKPKDLVKLCKENNMPAVGIADTNNMFAIGEFNKAAISEGVQPLIGAELSIDFSDIIDNSNFNFKKKKEQNGLPDYINLPNEYSKIVIIAKSEKGYLNLIKLISKAYIENPKLMESGKPSIAFNYLKEHHEGLIMLTGGNAGFLSLLAWEDKKQEAEEILKKLHNLFSDRLYIEIQRHNLDYEDHTEPFLIEMAYKHHIPLVATNEPYFKTKDVYEAHEALLAIADKTYLDDQHRRRLNEEYYFKSQDEMEEIFKDLPEAIENTVKIAKRCTFILPERKPIFPEYEVPEGYTEKEYLIELAEKGLEERIQEKSEEEKQKYRDQLKFELGMIEQMGFIRYFLVVQDFIKWARENGVPVGPGRGSGAGSIAAWALRIIDVDLFEYKLFFERFLNLERVNLPDFDIDFGQDTREKVVEYVKEKYGSDKVAQIVTFGTLKARAVLRDVGRVLKIPYGYVDRIVKLIPGDPGSKITIDEAIEEEAELRRLQREDETVAKLLEIGSKLEGLYRHASMHAAGVVITDRPLDELVPLYKDPSSEMPVTQYDWHWLENQGVIKYDFLGLTTLSVIKKTLKFVKEIHGKEIDILKIPYDRDVYAMLTEGKTKSVFQFESEVMTNTIMEVKPDSIDDLLAITALVRPGPMANVPMYVARKHGREEVSYPHPWLKDILEETYGIIVYQEQVMETAKKLAGYTLGSADLLRRAMGKKIPEEMEKHRQIFKEGCAKNGIDEAKAMEVFNLLEKFASYGFNKSHAAAYGIISYQTAYLKYHYPAEFIASAMHYEMHSQEKLYMLKEEAERLGMKVLAPDINKSFADFRVEDGNIRYALAAIKNVGEKAITKIVKEREENGEFKSLDDFINRVDPKNLNKRILEALIKAGVLDQIEPDRAKLAHNIELIISQIAQLAHDKETNQTNLFISGKDNTEKYENSKLALKTDYKQWSGAEKLSNEKEVIGFYFSKHPLEFFKDVIKKQNIKNYADIKQGYEGQSVKVAGVIEGIKKKTTKKGNKMALVTLSDLSELYRVNMFSESLMKYKDILQKDNMVVITGSAPNEAERMFMTVNSMKTFEQLAKYEAVAYNRVEIYIDYDAEKQREARSGIESLKEHIEKLKFGNTLLVFHITIADKIMKLSLPNRLFIPNTEIDEIKSIPIIKEVRVF